MKRLKMSQGNNQRKFKLLFFDEKVAVVNLLFSFLCMLLVFAYIFMRSNFPDVDISALGKALRTVLVLTFAVAVFFTFSWIWVTDRMHRFSIKKRICGIIVANIVINILVLILIEISDIGEVFD
ncbi:MAG: hypothetical protein IKK85_09980 [Clostridia bacterium]|nr:hypothetical protein [Clostridia bacterium]